MIDKFRAGGPAIIILTDIFILNVRKQNWLSLKALVNIVFDR